MADSDVLSPDLERATAALARALVTAVRNWSLYPPEHPGVAASVTRLHDAVRQTTGGRAFTLGIAPDTVLLDGMAVAHPDPQTREAAAMLHERDLVRLTFADEVAVDTLEALLAVLAQDTRTLRDRGGPAVIWQATGHASIVVEQIDYGFMLADRVVDDSRVRKDEVWFTLVRTIGNRQSTFGEAAQSRLLEIAGDAGAILELAADVTSTRCSSDGSPMLTTQASVILSAYKHLKSIVSVLAPDRAEALRQNLAASLTQIHPRVAGEVLRAAGMGSGDDRALVREVTDAFDDQSVAQLLATTLALDGRATTRLADIFDTFALDDTRRDRVVSLTRSALQQTGPGAGDGGAATTIARSMEELLLAHDDRPFVSDGYRAALDGASARAGSMAMAELPPEHGAWLETVDQEHVRVLSHTLLIDLLRLEHDPLRGADLVKDMIELAEEQIATGEYGPAAELAGAIDERIRQPTSAVREPCRHALAALGASAALREAVASLGDLDDAAAETFRVLCGAIGVPATDALVAALLIEERTPGRRRGMELLTAYGADAIGRLSPFAEHAQWFVRRNTAEVLGRIGAAACVPLLQTLLRGGDPRVLREAVVALAAIHDPAAARAIHTVLRATAGEARQAVVEALVEARDPRVVPVLVRILGESQPLGRDHPIVLDTLDALGRIRDERAVPPVAAVMHQRRWFARKRTRALKRAAVGTLVRIGTGPAIAALSQAATTGDRMLRRIVRSAGVR